MNIILAKDPEEINSLLHSNVFEFVDIQNTCLLRFNSTRKTDLNISRILFKKVILAHILKGTTTILINNVHERKGFVYPFMSNVFSHSYQLDESIFNVRVVGWHFTFLFKF